jgi:hypothetical protein
MLPGGTYITPDDEELLRDIEGQDGRTDDEKSITAPQKPERAISNGWGSEAVSKDEARTRLSALFGSSSNSEQAIATSENVRRSDEPPVNANHEADAPSAAKAKGVSAYFNGLINFGKKKTTPSPPPNQSMSKPRENISRGTRNASAAQGHGNETSGLDTWSVRDAEAFVLGMQKASAHSGKADMEDDSFDIDDAERLLNEPLDIGYKSSNQRHNSHGTGAARNAQQKRREHDAIQEEDDLMLPSYAREVFEMTAVRRPSKKGDAPRDQPNILFESSLTREDEAELRRGAAVQARPDYLLGQDLSALHKKASSSPSGHTVDKQSYLLGRETSRLGTPTAQPTHQRGNNSPRISASQHVEIVEFGVVRKSSFSSSSSQLSADIVKGRLEGLAARLDSQAKNENKSSARSSNDSSDTSRVSSPAKFDDGPHTSSLGPLLSINKPQASELGLRKPLVKQSSSHINALGAVDTSRSPSHKESVPPLHRQDSKLLTLQHDPSKLQTLDAKSPANLSSLAPRRPVPPAIKPIDPTTQSLLPGGLVPRPPTTSRNDRFRQLNDRPAINSDSSVVKLPAEGGTQTQTSTSPQGSSNSSSTTASPAGSAGRNPHARRFKDVAAVRPLSGGGTGQILVTLPEREDEADELFARMKKNALLRWWRTEVCA